MPDRYSWSLFCWPCVVENVHGERAATREFIAMHDDGTLKEKWLLKGLPLEWDDDRPLNHIGEQNIAGFGREFDGLVKVYDRKPYGGLVMIRADLIAQRGRHA